MRKPLSLEIGGEKHAEMGKKLFKSSILDLICQKWGSNAIKRFKGTFY